MTEFDDSKIHPGVTNPYLLKPHSENLERHIQISIATKLYAHLLVLSCRHSFILARLIAHLAPVRFENTSASIEIFHRLYSSALHRRTFCLPRTLFAISTSKTFAHSGTGYIGAFLPSKKLHAWIIENDINPDPKDDIWICYQPVAQISKHV
ncbi:MAG: hypothetical protein R2817_00770 [Flavobacteriales bacterium]